MKQEFEHVHILKQSKGEWTNTTFAWQLAE